MDTSVDSKFYFPDPKTTDPKARRAQRLFEVVPGLLTWTTLLGLPILSFFLPVWMAIVVIIFDIYWIFRSVYISLFSVVAHRDVEEGKRIDWWERCQNIQDPETYAAALKERLRVLREGLREMPLWYIFKRLVVKREIGRTKTIFRETKALIPLKDAIWDWRDIIHVVLLPTAGEPVDVIEPAIE